MKKIFILSKLFLFLLFLSVQASTNYHVIDDYIANQIVVDFKDNISNEDIENFEKIYNIDLNFNSIYSKEEKLTIGDIREGSIESFIEKVKNDKRVELVEPNYVYKAFMIPNDPKYKYQWHLDQINMKSAWDITKGDGVIVAIIDTGVAYEDYEDFHQVEDLKETLFVKGYDFVEDDEHPNDDNTHGTHVAGTVAQSTNNKLGVAGIAYKAKIMPIKVLNSLGIGTIADIADGVRFAADNGAKVINMSLGGPKPSQILEDACNYAYKKGVVIVCAAGNNGSNEVSYPAKYKVSIGVSATRYDEEVTRYSNYGKEIDLSAPGGDLNVDQNKDGMPDGVLQNTIIPYEPSKEDYLLFQGTSMASPHVAGTAALIISLGITRPDKVEEILKETAIDKGEKGWDEKYGYGIVNAKEAVKKAYLEDKIYKLFFSALISFIFIKFLKIKVFFQNFSSFIYIILGILIGSTGFFFLTPFVKSVIICRGFPDWGIAFFGIDSYQNPIFYSCLFPFLTSVFFLRKRRLNILSSGFSIGISATLLYYLIFTLADIKYIYGIFLDKVWLGLNFIITLFIAYLSMKKN